LEDNQVVELDTAFAIMMQHLEAFESIIEEQFVEEVMKFHVVEECL